jgi:transferrin binding protein
MSMPVRVSAVPMILMAALTACGGGGGGGSVHTPARVPAPVPAAVAGQAPEESAFTSFSAIAPNRTLVMSGVSQTGSGTDASFTLDPVSESNSAARLSFDADRNLSGISINTPQSGVAFGATETGCFSFGSCAAANAESLAVVMNPADLGWTYQSFGVWMTDVSPGSFQAGAFSAGAVTPGSAVPTVGSATFSGQAGGFYFDGAGARFATDAQMSAVTDFANRKIQFSTTGTLLTDTRTLAQTSSSGLDLRGNWSYAPGSSQFSGGVNTADGNLTGSASGRFYGPSAQEIGGVYGLGSPTGASRMIGGFGGKR